MNQAAVKTHFVVEEGPNPSSDYFVLPFLDASGASVTRYSFNQLPSAEQLRGADVTFVRYVPASWQRLLEAHRHHIASLNFFMDDDLFHWPAFARMPLRYQWKLLRYSWSKRRWLRKMGAQLQVSTPYLQQRYAGWSPRLLSPQTPPQLRDCVWGTSAGTSAEDPSGPVTLFYHGSASHGRDLEWLRPVIGEVLHRNPRLVFEVIGNHAVNRLFRGLPRVHVIHPMKWPSYQALIRRPGRAIGLAPLLDSAFNRARSHTKFLDITLAGAVGIYAEGPVYGSVVQHGQNGLLLPMQQGAWVDAILKLSGEPQLRLSLLEGARECL
ncbi:glycosyltransferase family 1 protein [Microbulbifer sp. SA54]|uniref:glycosyltransferase family 1 protein n=1 Tax=Microbulbifer sp. SA54 TaxID=3401577 RepID=UPI003AAF8704